VVEAAIIVTDTSRSVIACDWHSTAELIEKTPNNENNRRRIGLHGFSGVMNLPHGAKTYATARKERRYTRLRTSTFAHFHPQH